MFYWTLNNMFSLVKTVFYKLKDPLKALDIKHDGCSQRHENIEQQLFPAEPKPLLILQLRRENAKIFPKKHIIHRRDAVFKHIDAGATSVCCLKR